MPFESRQTGVKPNNRVVWYGAGYTVLLWTVVLLAVATLLLTLHNVLFHPTMATDPMMQIRQVYWSLYSQFSNPLSSPLVFVPFLVFLEVLRPAVKEDRVFSKGLAHDFFWILIHSATVGTFCLLYTSPSPRDS